MRLIESTPEEHDRSISKTLILSHFIGNTLMEFGAQEELIDTKGYRRFFEFWIPSKMTPINYLMR